MSATSKGVTEAVALLGRLGINTQSAKLKGFFKRPCLHYPLTDTYLSAAACAEAQRGEKEDDPNNDSAGDGRADEPIDLTVLDAQDTADAEAVMAQLLRTGLQADDQTQSPADDAFVEEISALLTAFNQSTQ